MKISICIFSCISLIQGLFAGITNEDGKSFKVDPQGAYMVEAPFFKCGCRDAIASIYDDNQCMASSPAEVWLLTYRNGEWIAVEKLGEGDGVYVELKDLEGDGLLELFITQRFITPDEVHDRLKLIDFKEKQGGDSRCGTSQQRNN